MVGLFNALKQRYITEPEEIGYRAYQQGMQQFGVGGEGSRADAAKHMAWQGALAQRTNPTIANALGLGKEVLMDGVGSVANWVGSGFKSEQSPLPTLRNSFQDLRNNTVGANQLQNSTDIAGDAVNLAAQAPKRGLGRLLNPMNWKSQEPAYMYDDPRKGI
jgi:hypothetical protein